MHRSARHDGLFLRALGRCWLSAALALAVGAGCSDSEKNVVKPSELPPRYPNLGPREGLPAFMKGTIYEHADAGGQEAYPVSGFGLVVNLAGTGDNTGTPLPVRNYMIDEMVRHRFGSPDERLKQFKPELVLQDRRTAIVEVYGFLPPGARAGERIDLFVRAVEGSQTKSLARGVLYQTDLKLHGADPLNPRGAINTFAKGKGPIFVNPAYAVSGARDAGAQASLRSGTVMNGGIVLRDRPLSLRARTPQLSITRAIEARIDQRFQSDTVARTQDEATIQILVPESFKADWEHFLGVVTHLYMNSSPAFAATKARELAAEAIKPGALLKDISFCWEGLGEEAIPFIQPLYAHPSADVAFAAARAGAFLRDPAAEEAVLQMAKNDANSFQLNAVKVLGALPPSTRLHRMLTEILASKNALARIEAYHTLAEQSSTAIISREVKDAFVLDLVPTRGAPLVYATRTGVPRIAIFGKDLPLNVPIIFRAMNDRFTISSSARDGRSVIVFDRTGDKIGGIEASMRPDLYELIWRLGGGSDDGFEFGYADLVGVLQALSDGRHIAAAFLLEDLPMMQDAIEDAPPIMEPAVLGPADASAAARDGEAPASAATR